MNWYNVCLHQTHQLHHCSYIYYDPVLGSGLLGNFIVILALCLLTELTLSLNTSTGTY